MGGVLDNFNGNFASFSLLIASFLVWAGGIAGILPLILTILSFFLVSINLMTIRLAAIENGCNEDAAKPFMAIEVIALLLPIFFGALGIVAIGAYLTFISTNSFVVATPACAYMNRA